jgi:hypothetical protein
MSNYDIFISYRSTNKPWVETLARNLKNIGYSRVFLDFWELIPGQNFNQQIYEALQTSPRAILVASAEAVDSGWVREEYTALFSRKQRDPEFLFVPIVFTEFPNFPFLSNVQAIDFGRHDYQQAFYRLTCGLEGVNPGEKSLCDSQLELPPRIVTQSTTPNSKSSLSFVETLFTHFEQTCPSPLLLLAQSDRSQAPMVQAVFTYAKTRYPPDRCLHLAPPYSTEEDIPGYFSMLVQQCGFDQPVKNGIEFERMFRTCLTDSKPLFLLISRFEHGTETTRKQLAGILRSLNETHANQLHIVLCGGEKLAELKYLQGSLSLLNTAQDYRWPELGPAEVYAIRDSCCKPLTLTAEVVTHLLDISGGHPTLLQASLLLYQQQPQLNWSEYPQVLSEDPYVWQLFTPFTNNPSDAQQIHQWLSQAEVAPAKPFLLNPLLRRLYWKNLLVERPAKGRKWLYWRSEVIRLAGLEILS